MARNSRFLAIPSPRFNSGSFKCILRRTGLEIVPFDPEIERTFRRRLREARLLEEEVEQQREAMADQNQRPLRDYALPTTSGIHSAILMPTIGANNIEIKPPMIQMM